MSLCGQIPEVFRATKTLVGKRGKGKHLETLRRGRRGQQTLPKCRGWVMDGMCRGHTQVQCSCQAPCLPRAPWWPLLGAPKLPRQQGCGQTGGLGLLLPPCPPQQGAGRSGSELDATFELKSIVRGSRLSPVLPWQLYRHRSVVLWLLPSPAGE